MFTRTIKVNLLLKWLLCSNLSQFYCYSAKIMSVINNHCSWGTHRHFNKGHNIVGVKLLKRCLPPVFCSLPFFPEGRGGGSLHRLVFCVQVTDRLQRRDQSNKKWLLGLAGLCCTIPHCLIIWKQLARNNYVSKGLFFLEVALFFDPLAIFHG